MISRAEILFILNLISQKHAFVAICLNKTYNPFRDTRWLAYRIRQNRGFSDAMFGFMKFLRTVVVLGMLVASHAIAGEPYRLMAFPPIMASNDKNYALGEQAASDFLLMAQRLIGHDSSYLVTSKPLSDSLLRCKDSMECLGKTMVDRRPGTVLFTYVKPDRYGVKIQFSVFNVETWKFMSSTSVRVSEKDELDKVLFPIIHKALSKVSGIWKAVIPVPQVQAPFPPSVVIPAGTIDQKLWIRENDTTRIQRRFAISSFMATKTEVTWADYQNCVRSGVCSEAQYTHGTCSKVWDDGSWGPGYVTEPEAGSTVPVVCVDWVQARDFCAWVGGTLPTQMQWEYMARAGNTNQAPWDNPKESCRHENLRDLDYIKHRPTFGETYNCHDGYENAAPVGRFPPNAFGLYDMIGNVREWARDNYEFIKLSQADSIDPVVEEPSNYWAKMRMGSAFSSNKAWGINFDYREGTYVGNTTESVGFRCVKGIQ